MPDDNQTFTEYIESSLDVEIENFVSKMPLLRIIFYHITPALLELNNIALTRLSNGKAMSYDSQTFIEH